MCRRLDSHNRARSLVRIYSADTIVDMLDRVAPANSLGNPFDYSAIFTN